MNNVKLSARCTSNASPTAGTNEKKCRVILCYVCVLQYTVVTIVHTEYLVLVCEVVLRAVPASLAHTCEHIHGRV